MILPRPRLVNSVALVESIQRAGAKERRKSARDVRQYSDAELRTPDGARRVLRTLVSSCHIEAAARILVARRCKQAGMHWRHHNAACVCAIIARLRSAA